MAMTKTKKARLRAAKKELRDELRRLLDKRGAVDRWREREPNPRAYMTESGWLRWH